MTIVGRLQWFIGIMITRDRSAKSLAICQDLYINNFCTRFEGSLLVGMFASRDCLPRGVVCFEAFAIIVFPDA